MKLKLFIFTLLLPCIVVSCKSKSSQQAEGIQVDKEQIAEYVQRFEDSDLNANFNEKELEEINEYLTSLIPEFVDLTDKLADGYDQYFINKYGHKYDFMLYPEVSFEYMENQIPELKEWLDFVNGDFGKVSHILFASEYPLDFKSNPYSSKANYYQNILAWLSASGAPDLAEMMDSIMKLREFGSLDKVRQYDEEYYRMLNE